MIRATDPKTKPVERSDGGSIDVNVRSATAVEMRRELFRLVAPKEPVQLGGDDGPHVLLVDAGAKDNLARSFSSGGPA